MTEDTFSMDTFTRDAAPTPAEPAYPPAHDLSDLIEYEDPEEMTATAGTPLPPGAEVAKPDAVIDALKEVYDPEIPVNIYDLGLIYDMDLKDNGNVTVQMTLTAPACPVAGEMPGDVANAVAGVDGVGEVTVHMVWDPPWTPDRMSEDAKMALDFF